MQELPNAHKLVCLYRLPLRGRHAEVVSAAEVVVPYDHGTHPTVGRVDSARRCRNYRVGTSLFMRTVCRCAVGGDMSPPYRGGSVYDGDRVERSDAADLFRDSLKKRELHLPSADNPASLLPKEERHLPGCTLIHTEALP